MNKNLSKDYYEDDGHPIMCIFCDSIKMGRRTVDIIAHTVCEQEWYCTECDTILGYWAYGSFDPNYITEPFVPPELFRIND